MYPTPPPSDEDMHKVLDFDALDTAEKLTGKSVEESESTKSLSLKMHFFGGRMTREMLTARDDTHYSISYENAERIIKDIGFEDVLVIPFTGRYAEESFRIMYRNGILLTFESYSHTHETRVNTIVMYFCWRAHNQSRLNHFSGSIRDGIHRGYLDGREALRLRISNLDNLGELVPWDEEMHRPWLIHYMDLKDTSEVFSRKAYIDQTIKDRLNALPLRVRKELGING